MQVAIISGNNRKDSQTLKVARFAETIIHFSTIFDEQFFCDLGGMHAAGLWAPDGLETISLPLKQEFQKSHGFVIVTPEWNGMVPPALKNLLMQCGPEEFGHKPALIVAVSAGVGGSYPVVELRTTAYKNNRINFIPDHVIVRDVGNVMNDFKTVASDRDAEIRDRLKYSLRELGLYSKALQPVRQNAHIDFERFPNGM